MREVSVDNVVEDLLDLFDYLGINAGGLSERFRRVRVTKRVGHKTYSHASAIGEMLTLWHQHPDFLDKAGNPAPLRKTGLRRSFRQLAERAVPNMNAKKLLAELAQIGAISIDGNGFIHAQMRSLPVYEDKRLARQHTLTSLRNFLITLRHNLNSAPSNSAQLFHRVAWNGAIDLKQVPRLKIWVKNRGQTFLESADSWMMHKSKEVSRSAKRRGKLVQISLGVYLTIDKS
jgi:hypothetical protein